MPKRAASAVIGAIGTAHVDHLIVGTGFQNPAGSGAPVVRLRAMIQTSSRGRRPLAALHLVQFCGA